MEVGESSLPHSTEIFTIFKLGPQPPTCFSPPTTCLAAPETPPSGCCDLVAGTPTAVRTGNDFKAAGVDKCWWVAVLAFLMITMQSAPNRSSGMLMVGIMEQMNTDRGLASWPVSLIGTLMDCGGIFSGPLSEVFATTSVLIGGSVLASAGLMASAFAPDIAWLIFTLGVMHGIGLGTVMATLQVLISMYFERYRGAANGIMLAGATASAFIFPKLLLCFRDAYGFRGSLLLFGGVLLNMVAISLAFREPPWIRCKRTKRRKDPEEPRRTSLTTAKSKMGTVAFSNMDAFGKLRGVLNSGITYVLVVTWIVFSYNCDVFLSTIVDFLMDKGQPLEEAVSFITYTSITDLVGRTLIPCTIDSGLLQRSTLMTVNYLFMGFCAISLPFCESYWTLLMSCLGFGLSLGCAITMQSVLTAHYLGLDRLSVGYGVIGAFSGPVALGKAPFVGFFRDNLGSYGDMFWVLGSFSFTVSAVWFLLRLHDRKSTRKWQLHDVRM